MRVGFESINFDDFVEYCNKMFLILLIIFFESKIIMFNCTYLHIFLLKNRIRLKNANIIMKKKHLCFFFWVFLEEWKEIVWNYFGFCFVIS